MNQVLVAGASGLVGTATLDSFLADDWDAVAVARRRPEVGSGKPFRHLAVDLRDEKAARAALAGLSGITHVVYAAVFEKPGLVAGWAEQDHMDINMEMLRNLLEPLSATASLRHVTLLQGTKAYGMHLHPIAVPAREHHPRDDHANFYWLQEDYVAEKAAREGWNWTIMRPQLVVGPNTGSAMSIPPVLGVYAAICAEEGRPFGFPGGPHWVWEAADVRLVADAIRWAATAENARDQHFNLTNGEVFAWRDLWPSFAEVLGVPPGPDEPLPLAEFLPARADTWDKIVEKYDLRPTTMLDLLGESHHLADFAFAYGFPEPPPPTFVSTVKIKQAGFTDVYDTEESFRHWLRVLIDRRIVPDLH